EPLEHHKQRRLGIGVAPEALDAQIGGRARAELLGCVGEALEGAQLLPALGDERRDQRPVAIQDRAPGRALVELELDLSAGFEVGRKSAGGVESEGPERVMEAAITHARAFATSAPNSSLVASS